MSEFVYPVDFTEVLGLYAMTYSRKEFLHIN
jgi:hypothetical protein